MPNCARLSRKAALTYSGTRRGAFRPYCLTSLGRGMKGGGLDGLGGPLPLGCVHHREILSSEAIAVFAGVVEEYAIPVVALLVAEIR